MNEKRFTFYYERGNEVVIEDNGKRLSNKQLVNLLNEQQATITAQKKGLDEYMDNIIALSKENEQLRQGFNELLAVHTKIIQTLDDEFVSKALLDGGDDV